jgi:hypothetical protein
MEDVDAQERTTQTLSDADLTDPVQHREDASPDALLLLLRPRPVSSRPEESLNWTSPGGDGLTVYNEGPPPHCTVEPATAGEYHSTI